MIHNFFYNLARKNGGRPVDPAKEGGNNEAINYCVEVCSGRFVESVRKKALEAIPRLWVKTPALQKFSTPRVA
jgi:hypothetical protein